MNTNNFFGTDGIRKRIGTRPLAQNDLPKLAHAIAQWLIHKFGTKAGLVITHDSRESSPWMKTTLLSTLLEYPFLIYDMHMAPTGAASWIVQTMPEVQCGLVITASHNPYYDNGIKIILKNEKITPRDQQLLSNLFFATQKSFTYSSFGTYFGENSLLDTYHKSLISKFRPNFLAGKTIVIDCANGAASTIAPKLFTQCGAHVITIHNKPNGKNINDHCGSLYPQETQKMVLKHNADIGFCFDGDGDRVVVINNNGQLKDGDNILGLLLENPLYKNQVEIVGTIMSNQSLQDYCYKKSIRFARTAVGDSHVLEYLHKKDLLLGGEPCGHIILNDHLPTSDGLYVALQVAHTCILLNNFSINQITKYPQASINIPYIQKVSLQSAKMKLILTKAQQSGARVIIRYSGTQPVLRIMVEAKTQELAQTTLHEIATKCKIIIGQKEIYDKKNKASELQRC